jgi:hypothetical protein
MAGKGGGGGGANLDDLVNSDKYNQARALSSVYKKCAKQYKMAGKGWRGKSILTTWREF